VSPLDRLTLHIRDRALIQPGETVMVAYSGGADSTFLLTLLHESGLFDVVAGHLDHGQRPEADEEATSCQAYCDHLGVPLVIGKSDVPLMAQHLKIGLEEAGRHARYAFFRQAAHALNADVTATGHTLDDHVETVLMNLIRGTGLAGLAGIPERRDGVIRPMLQFRRAETRLFCQERGLWFHDDPANFDSHHLRSLVRHQALPLFESWEPAFAAQVERMAMIANEEDQFLDGAAAALLESAEQPLNGDLGFLTRDLEAKFSIPYLISSPAVLAKRAIRLAAEFLGPRLDFVQTQAVFDGIRSGIRGSVTTDGGAATLTWSDRSLHVQRQSPEVPSRYPLIVPGEVESEVFGFRIVANSASVDTVAGKLEGVIAVESIKGGLFLRGHQPGDRIDPAQRGVTKKVVDLFQEANLTLLARRRLPIICDMVGPVWVPGCALAKRAQVTQFTTQALRLTFEPLSGG